MAGATRTIRDLIGRHPLLTYFGISFAGFWACLPLRSVSWLLQFAGVFAPAMAAVAVLGLTEGESSIRALVRRLGEWRIGLTWYLVVVGLPIAKGVLAIAVATQLGSSTAARIDPLPPDVWLIAWVSFVFAAGEELGWRGFALPRLMERRSALTASMILGSAHTIWHLPLILLPHQMLSGTPVGAYATFVIAEAILFTWIYQHTGGSLLAATLYHGMSNLAGVFYAGIDRNWIPWIRPAMSALPAIAVVLMCGKNLHDTRQPIY